MSAMQALKGYWEPLCCPGLTQEEKGPRLYSSCLPQTWLLKPLLFLVVHPSTLLSPDLTAQHLCGWTLAQRFPLTSQALI